MFYKHFEVYMYDREPVIVTGKSRAQVGRDFKRIYGHDAVDEVKPISGRSVESRYGFEYKQIVKANTMVNTPEGNTPYINEETMELKSYGFYEVKLVGTDETEIVIGSSLEKVKAEMEEAFGDMLDSVTEVAGDELTSDDPTDPTKNHEMNVSILSGRNPFSESVDEMTGIAKAMTHPSGTGKRYFASQKDRIKKELEKTKARRDALTMDKEKHDTDKRKAASEETEKSIEDVIEAKRGLWANIHAKRKRIKAGSGEKMRKPGSDGAPSDKDLKDSQKEDVQEETLAEGADKLMYLARVGLMSKNELTLLRRAMSQKSSGQPISVQTRKILFKLLDKMVSLVIKNPHMFNQAKRKVMQEAWDEALGELQDKELTEAFIQRIDYLDEAGYMDQPKTKAEVKKKFPDTETDVKNKKSKDLQTVKYK